MGIFDRIFGTDKAIENVIDKEDGLIAKAGGWIDRQQFTPEERAEHYKELSALRLKMLDALSQFKIVQRMIVFAVMGAWSFLLINYVAAIWFDFNEARTHLLTLMTHDYMTVFLYGVGFLYLGGGAIESFKRGGK